MSEGFKVGDLVRRTKCDFGEVKVGGIYRVSYFVNGAVDLEGFSRIGGGEYDPYNFSLIYRPGDPESWKPEVGDPVKWTCQADSSYGNVYHVTEVDTSGRVWVVQVRARAGVGVTRRVGIDRKLYGGAGDRCQAAGFLNYITPITTAEAETTKEEAVSETKPAALEPGMIVRFKPGAFEPGTGGGSGAWTSATYRPTRGELLGQFGNRWDVKPLNGSSLASQSVKTEHLIPEESTVSTTDNPELEAFKKKVRDAVIAEAKAQGWRSRTDGWLEELGLEPREKLPKAIGTVVECKERDFGIYYAVRVSDEHWKCFGATTGMDYDEDVLQFFQSVIFDPSA